MGNYRGERTMSDPAVKAANSAIARHWQISGPAMKPFLPVINSAAREALAPIRDLHKPKLGNCGHMCCSGEDCRMPTHVCAHSYDLLALRHSEVDLHHRGA